MREPGAERVTGEGLGPQRRTPSIPQLMTLAEVARALRLSEKTVRRMVARRRMPCVRIGRSLRFDEADVSRFVAARKE